MHGWLQIEDCGGAFAGHLPRGDPNILTSAGILYQTTIPYISCIKDASSLRKRRMTQQHFIHLSLITLLFAFAKKNMKLAKLSFFQSLCFLRRPIPLAPIASTPLMATLLLPSSPHQEPHRWGRTKWRSKRRRWSAETGTEGGDGV